jgi:2,4-dienoyl-CoA reductase (NADPH2)
MLLAEEPNAVIIATGAEPVAPDLPGDGSVPVVAACSADDLARVPGRPGAKLLLMDEDGYFWAAAIAEAAAARAGTGRLVVATRFFEPFRELPMVSRIATLRALDHAGAEHRTSMAPVRLETGAVVLQHYLTGREEAVEGCATLLWVGAQRARDGLYGELREAGLERTHLVGDAFAPRRVAVALVEAQTVAHAV